MVTITIIIITIPIGVAVARPSKHIGCQTKEAHEQQSKAAVAVLHREPHHGTPNPVRQRLSRLLCSSSAATTGILWRFKHGQRRLCDELNQLLMLVLQELYGLGDEPWVDLLLQLCEILSVLWRQMGCEHALPAMQHLAFLWGRGGGMNVTNN